MFLPHVFHEIMMKFVYTLRLLHPLRLLHLISSIVHKIYAFTTNIHLKTRRRQKLLTWLREALPAGRQVNDLTTVWRDGTILCDVIESVVPGSCSGQLRKCYSHKSIQHGQILAAKHLHVRQVFTYDDLHQVIFSSYLERRLFRYLASVRCAVFHLGQSNGANTLTRHLRLFRGTQSIAPEPQEKPSRLPVDCVVRGMGLAVAVQQRRALFCIYLLQPPYQLSPPDIEVRIEGPNSGYGEVTIQQTYFNKSNKQTSDHSASLINRSNKLLHNIPINYRVMSGYIRVNYIPQSPGIHKLSVIMHNEHVSASPYLITVDKKVENVTGQLSNGIPIARDVSRIRKEGRRPNVLLRIVDFVTEKMLLTEDGKLKKLPSGNMVTTSRIPRQVAVEISGHKAENGNISDIDTTKREGSSLRMSPPNSGTNLAVPQRHKLKRRDLDFFRDRCKKVTLLCRFFVKRNLSHNNFHILHSAEQFLDGRPVRLTDKTFKLIETGLKSIKQEIEEDNRDENRSHMPTELINFSKLKSVEPNLSRVQHKEKIRDMRLNTEITVGDNSGYDLNCTELSTICYDVDHSSKHEVCDANNINEGTEANGTKAKNVVSSSCGAQHAKIWEEGLSMGTSSREISMSLIPFIQQYANLKLETMSTVKFPDKHIQKEPAELIPETTDIKVTADKLRVGQIIMKSMQERQCLTENESRRNTTVCEASDVLTSTEYEVPFSSICKQGATFISAKKGMDIISYLSSPFVPKFDNYQGNKNETHVRLNHVLRTENANERVNYWICHTTAFASATGIEYKNTACKISASAGRNFEGKEMCSVRDTRRYLQSAKHPAQVITTCEHSELQTEDEASHEKCWEGKNDESSTDIIGSTKNDSIKVTEILTNEGIPSDDEKNHMNSQAGQTTGTKLVDMSSNISNSVTETEEEDTVFRRDIRQKPAEDLETDDLVNITCSSCRANNTNVYTLLPQMLQEPREDSSLQLDTACEQIGATCTSLLAGNTSDYKTRVEPASACNPSRNDSCHTSNTFPDLEDMFSQISTAYMASSSNDDQEHLFHLRSSDTRFESSPGVTAGLYDDNALDSESVLADPNLEETLHKLDKMLGVIKERDTSDNAYKLSDISVSTEEEALTPSPESCSTEDSTVAEDNKVHFCIKGYGEVMRGSPNSESRNISVLTSAKNYRKQNIFQFSVRNQRRQQLLENSNATVSRFKSPANKETWAVTADEIKYDTGSDDNGTPLYADLTSNLVQMRRCSGILPEIAPLMTSTEEENKENNGNDITDRYTGLNVHLQNNSESSGKLSVMSVSSPLTIPEKNDEKEEGEDENIEDFAEEYKPPNTLILETNFTDMETLKNIVISNGMGLHSESDSCASSKIEYSGTTAKEIMCIPAITEAMATPRAAPILERNEHLGNIKNALTCTVKRQTRKRYFTIDHQSNQFYYNKNKIKNRRDSLAQNTEYSSNYADYVLPGIVMQPTAAPGANTLQKKNTNILDPLKSHDYIPEVSKSIRLEPPNVGANSSLDKNTKIPESQRESEQSPLAAFVNTVDVKRVSNSYSQSQMAENNLTEKSSLLLPGFLTVMCENTLHAPVHPPERVRETYNNVTASSVSNMLYNAENSDVKLHGENVDPNRSRRIIIDRKITHEMTNNITSRTVQGFSEVDNRVLSITSNEKRAVNEQTHLSETEKSYTKIGGLTNQKIYKLCNNVFPSHINRRISPSLLPNINIDFRGSSELFQENETVNIHKRVLTSQKRNETPVGKSETKLSLTKYSARQCEEFMLLSTCNKNKISPLEEWTITARHPVTHSSQTDRVAHSMPQTAGDTSLAISLPQPGVITTDMNILHPLVAKKTDPRGSIGETQHDNKLSNKIYENFDSTAKKAHENKDFVVCGTEYLKSQVPIRSDVGMPNQNLHQVVATKYCNSVAYNRRDNYVRDREIETKIPEIITTNICTYENSLNDECVNNDCKLIDPENERFKKSMEYKIPDKMQNDVAIMELKTIQDIMRNYFMKHRANVQDLLTPDSINRFAECMQVTQKKEYLDKKWMKQSDWQDEQQVKINDIYDYNKYQQCFTSNINHWSTNRRLTPVYKTEKVNTWNQAFPSPITCNTNAVAECSGSDLARSQKTANKYLMYKNINTSRQELVQISGLMRTGRIKLEGKCSAYISQKGTVLHVDGGITSVGKFQNRQVFEHYIQIYRYSPAVISPNFTPTTSPVLSSSTALYKRPQTDSDDEVDSHYRTAKNSFQNEQKNEKLTDGTANKQLQIMKEENTSIVPTETENCDLNKTKFEELVGTQNEIYRAKLVHITDDGYIVPTLQTLLLMPSQSNSINRKSFERGSQNRTGFSLEQYGDEGSVYINHDNSDLYQLVYSKETGKIYRRLMSKEDVRTESRLRFQRAKLFFQKFQQNTSE